MNFRLNLQWKLTLSFILIAAFVVFFVYFLSNYYIIQHFEEFCDFYGAKIPKCLSEEGGQRFVLAINKTLIWVGSVSFVLAFIFGYFASRFFLSPIDNIILAVKSFSKGSHKTRIDLQASDEMKNLTNSLNEMFDNMEKTEKLRKDLTANISHELATPLTNIYGYLEALTDKVITNKEEKEATLNIIKNETERLIKLTRELKSLALLESEKSHLNLEKANINELIRNTVQNFNPQIENKGIIIKQALDSGLPAIKIDSHKFQQAFSNILDNAISYSPRKGEIKIKTEQKESGLFISVKDSGKGIKKEDLPFIFERFYQGNKSRSGQGKNIGIGLTIVKKIIESHQGKIEAFSQKGKGSEFVITLPKK